MSSAKEEKSYQALSAELDGLLSRLQQPDVHVDEAVELYEQGLSLVAQLEKQLQKADNKLHTLKLKAGE